MSDDRESMGDDEDKNKKKKRKKEDQSSSKSSTPKALKISASNPNSVSSSKPGDEVIKEYKCRYCDRTFTSFTVLGGHQTAHREERASGIPVPSFDPLLLHQIQASLLQFAPPDGLLAPPMPEASWPHGGGIGYENQLGMQQVQQNTPPTAPQLFGSTSSAAAAIPQLDLGLLVGQTQSQTPASLAESITANTNFNNDLPPPLPPPPPPGDPIGGLRGNNNDDNTSEEELDLSLKL